MLGFASWLKNEEAMFSWKKIRDVIVLEYSESLKHWEIWFLTGVRVCVCARLIFHFLNHYNS